MGLVALHQEITELEGEPASMTRGRVVTEHDILPGAWYLDCGRIPTCIAVEAGQADLFLSGYLGIDFITKGLAVYRLLDAEVSFHDSLPLPGSVIRYDIKILRFMRQNDTWLFFFEFDGTVPDGHGLASACAANASCPVAAATAKPPTRTANFTFAMPTPYVTASAAAGGTRPWNRLSLRGSRRGAPCRRSRRPLQSHRG